MRSRSSLDPLIEELEKFQQRIRGLALEIVRAIVREELETRIGQLEASLAAPATSRRRTRRPTRAKPRTTIVDPVPPPVQPTVVRADGKRRWTRDAIVDELATWLASGTTIDASFLTRYGPRGLVAASKKEFGRFEAALNVASLRVSKLYPDKPSRFAS